MDLLACLVVIPLMIAMGLYTLGIFFICEVFFFIHNVLDYFTKFFLDD